VRFAGTVTMDSTSVDFDAQIEEPEDAQPTSELVQGQ